jgi:hypothetical protein
MDTKTINSTDYIHPDARVSLPVMMVPLFATRIAKQRDASNNLLFTTWGGIGDVICSEPTVRYAIDRFKDCKITVATQHPELFQHLNLHDTYDLKKENPIMDDYLVLQTIPTQNESSLTSQFISHMLINCLDFPALSALRLQLPIADRYVILRPTQPQDQTVLDIINEKQKYVVVHAGRHWKSKTFPTDWWNAVLNSIKQEGLIPVLIGKHDGETQGYVDTASDGCIDLRDKTSLNDSVWLLQRAAVVVCNDSSPLHMAVTGDAFVLFVASVKHTDYITHYRKPFTIAGRDVPPEWSWRMENLGKDGLWNSFDSCPNKTEDVNVDNVDPELILRLLPDSKSIGPLCKEKIDEYFRSI